MDTLFSGGRLPPCVFFSRTCKPLTRAKATKQLKLKVSVAVVII